HQFHAGAVGQAHVGQAQVERLAGQPFAGFLEVARAAGVEFHAPKGDFQQFTNVGFVIHDQGYLATHGTDSFLLLEVTDSSPQLTLRGWAKMMRKQLPPSGRERYARRAWLPSQSSREIYRPRPVPLLSVV